MKEPYVELSPEVSEEVRQTTCYMCACRCGIDVHMKDGKVAYIEGNRSHPVNKGVLCAKGSAGVMQVNSPSRLRSPLRRVGERGRGEFEEISWEEALSEVTDRLLKIRREAPERLAFFTGRDQSQSFTSYWAQEFGTPNYAAHGGFCSVNMATAGIYTMGGAFWEFGQPDFERTKYLMLFGVAEDHDSNPIKMGLGKMKGRGAKVVGVNPVRTGYNAIADEWIGITPGSDGLFIMSLIYELLRSGKVDTDYLSCYTNAPFLLEGGDGERSGLFLRDGDGKPLVMDRVSGKLVAFDGKGVRPDLRGDGKHETVFGKLVETYLSDCYAPEKVSERCGVPVETICRIASELAHVAFEESIELPIAWTDFRGEHHEVMLGRPVSFHAMRGISAHGNGFQTCRALHILQILLGSVEVPGGFRFKPPYPKPAEIHPKPHSDCHVNCPLDGPHLGFVMGPEDLALKIDGRAARIDKAFTWENPLSSHGLMHMVISNAYAGDPYKIDTLFFYMANMAWNSSMDTGGVMEKLTAKDDEGNYVIPYIVYSDAYASEMVAYADIVLPDTTYLERHDCISLLDRPISEPDGAADAIRWPVVDAGRDVRGFQSVLCDLGHRLGLGGFVTEDGEAKYKDYADYIVHHERKPGIGPLSGYRGEDGSLSGRGGVNEDQLDRYKEGGGFFVSPIEAGSSFYKPWNMSYQDWAVGMGFYEKPSPYVFQLYVEPLRKFQLAAEGYGEIQPPDHLRDSLKSRMTPFPEWYESTDEDDDYPLHALTQRPMAMYHSWGSQNAWLRQIHGMNPLYVPLRVWREHGFEEGDWAKVTSRHGEITVPVALHRGLNGHTVWTWNAIGKRRGAWGLGEGSPESTKGFLLNHLIDDLLPLKDGERVSNSDPVTGQAAWFDLKVRLEKVSPRKSSEPVFEELKSPVGVGPKVVSFKVGR